MVHNYRYKVQAIRRRSARDLIKYVSIDVYNRIGFVHRNSTSKTMIRIGEETLTENLVYELHKFTLEQGMTLVRLFESIGEDTNGADMLLDVPVGDEYIRIPVQAKKLSPHKRGDNGSYLSFRHSNSNGLQSDLLKQYAEDLGSYLPVYLLYNFTSGNTANIARGEKEYYYGISYFNLNSSIVTTLPNTVRFSHLHSSHANPFYKLFDRLGGGSNNGGTGGGGNPPGSPNDPNDVIREVYERFGVKKSEITDEFIQNIRRYTPDEIFADTDNWTNAFSVGRRPAEKDEIITSERPGFRPRYRMVLLSDPLTPEQEAQMQGTVVGDAKVLDDEENDPFVEHEPEVEEFEKYQVYCEA